MAARTWRDSRRSQRADAAQARGYHVPFYDPDAAMPRYPYRMAPDGLLTRRQMRAENLAPGGRGPVARLEWKHRGPRRERSMRFAWLYDRDKCVPKRVPTPRQLAAIHAATLARHICKSCDEFKDYEISKALGECNDCHDRATGVTREAEPVQDTDWVIPEPRGERELERTA